MVPKLIPTLLTVQVVPIAAETVSVPVAVLKASASPWIANAASAAANASFK
jgi:hypothetical protein